MNSDLRKIISKKAGKEGLDTVFIFYDGGGYVSGPKNKFGQSVGMPVAGHGMATRVGMPEQVYACLHLDVVAVPDNKHLVERGDTANITYTEWHKLQEPASNTEQSSNSYVSKGREEYMFEAINSFYTEDTLSRWHHAHYL